MSDKTSLYVVEKKEVVILVVLFVLVTVLSFTLGVRYGESLGRKEAAQQLQAAKEHGDESGAGGGVLGGGPREESPGASPGEKTADADRKGHGEAESGAAHPAEKGEHGNGTAAHSEAKEHAPPAPRSPEEEADASPAGTTHEGVDKNSDEYLLSALKEAGVEPPGGKAPHGAKLPDAVKEARKGAGTRPPLAHSGAYVIQVGSHPTRNEAEIQVRRLQAKKVECEILPPFQDRQGEWHRVVIAGFKSKRDAEREAAALKGRRAIVSYFIWRLP